MRPFSIKQWPRLHWKGRRRKFSTGQDHSLRSGHMCTRESCFSHLAVSFCVAISCVLYVSPRNYDFGPNHGPTEIRVGHHALSSGARVVAHPLHTKFGQGTPTPKCPPRPRTDGPRAADILTHGISSAIAACTLALPPAPRTRAQVRLAPIAPTTPAMRSRLMDLHEHAARGVRPAHRRPLGARRWCVRRERRAAGTWVGGCGGEQPGHGDDRERRSSSRQRARRSRRRGTSGGCSEHARQMGAAPPPPAAPSTNRRLGDRGARR